MVNAERKAAANVLCTADVGCVPSAVRGVYVYLPEEPKPPIPRTVSDSSVTHSNVAFNTGTNKNCRSLSPCDHVKALPSLVLSVAIHSPR